VVVYCSCSSGVVHWAPSQSLRCWRAELTCCEIRICHGLVLYVDARSLRGDLVLFLVFVDGWWRFGVETYSKAFLLASVKALIIEGSVVSVL